MVTTRSMLSGTTKKIDTKIAAVNDKQKAAKRASNKAKSRTTKIDDTKECTYVRGRPLIVDAHSLFMKEFKEKYYNVHPPCPKRGGISFELTEAIWQQWRNMSDMDKAPYFENAKKMRAAKEKEMRDAKKMRAEGHSPHFELFL